MLKKNLFMYQKCANVYYLYGHGGGPHLSETGSGDGGLWEGNKERTLYLEWVLLASVLLKAASDRNLN